MQKKISILVGIIIIVLVAVVLAGGFFAYQYFETKNQLNKQTNQTTAWKTYTDNNVGFQIKYPNDWTYYTYLEDATDNSYNPRVNFPVFYKVNKDDSGCSLQIFSKKAEGLTDADTYSQEEIKLGGKIDSSNFSNFVKNVALSIGFPPGFSHKIEDTTVNGMQAGMFSTNPVGDDVEYDIFTPNYIFIVDEGFGLPMGTVKKQAPLSDSEKKECKNNFDSMLSNLKITTPISQKENIMKPDFSFDVQGTYCDNEVNICAGADVTIKDETSGKVIQTITLDDLNLNPGTSLKDIVDYSTDFNLDGYKDLKILTDMPGDNPPGYQFYFYNPETDKFDFQQIKGDGPIFDSKAGTISTHTNEGCAGSDGEAYEYSLINGKYVLTSEADSYCCVGYDKNFRVEVSKLVNGTMQKSQEACPQ